MAWAVHIRWLVIAGFFALALLARALGLLTTLVPCAIAAGIGVGLNAVNHWSVQRGRRLGAVTIIAVLADQVIITFVVANSGGLESPFVLMYVVQVLTSAMLVDELAAAATAIWAIALWGVLLWLQAEGLFPIRGLSDLRHGSPLWFQALWATFLLYCLALLTYVGGRISRRLSASEHDLAQRHTELERTLAERNAAFDRLKRAEAQLVQSEKMRALGQMVAGVAHELNNPISFVSANVGHLERHVGVVLERIGHSADPDLRRAVEELPSIVADCREGARRSKQILDDLRLFVRGDGSERWQRCDLHGGIDRALAVLSHRIAPTIKVRRDYGVLAEIECLPGQLNQVFLNLLGNAIDAIGDSAGEIGIVTRPIRCDTPDADAVEIAVRDDGCGMSDETLCRAAEPFFTTKPIGQGTGLGLSICQGIIERHHGSLGFARSESGGTTAILRLPVRQNPAIAG